MPKTTLAMLGWLGALLAFAPAAHGCTLAPYVASDKMSADEQRVRSADVAIYGVVSSVRTLDPARGGGIA